MRILVVLGAPNSPSGELSGISKSRLACCKEIFNKEQLILCTGGWGAHFNTSDKPHAYYGKKYLIENGLSESNFLAFALSENTVDDAIKVKSIVSNLDNVELTVITSDFHVERAKLIFNEVLKEYEIEFLGVKSDLTEEELIKLTAHEHRAITSIRKNGLYF